MVVVVLAFGELAGADETARSGAWELDEPEAPSGVVIETEFVEKDEGKLC